jgi:phosphatidylinositol alpha-1,6-mannosyltransferase
MTTLLVSDIFPPKTGGSGRWFWEIYRRLPREDFVIAAGEDPRQMDFDRSHNLRVMRLPLTMRSWGLLSGAGLAGYWRTVRMLRRVVRDERVEKVHCARCMPEGVMALALKWWCGVPYSCYVHGEDVNLASTSRELRWLAKRVLRGADFAISNSRNTERILKEEWHLPDQRIRLMHPGVDIKRFVPAARSHTTRDRLGWDDRQVLLTVGRLQKRKGHDQMISALPVIRRTIPDILYAIVGDGDERRFLENLVAQEGLEKHVQFLGELDDEGLVHCYQQCDLFALPNRQVGRDIEGFGMVLLEAQACGKPVVAGNSGGTAETMRIPETGLVVNCDGPQALAALVVELLGDRRRLAQMSTAARQWVVEHFDWAALSRQAEQIFHVGTRPLPSSLAAAAVHS